LRKAQIDSTQERYDPEGVGILRPDEYPADAGCVTAHQS